MSAPSAQEWQDAVDLLTAEPCRTASLPLVGAGETGRDRLRRRYGSEAAEVAASGPLTPVADGVPVLEAELHWGLRAEGALNAEETGWVVRLGEVALREGDERAATRQFQKVLVTHPHSFQALYLLGYLAWRRGDAPEARRRFDAAFAALGPQAAPAPGEGDVRKAEKPLPRRGAFSGLWAYLARGGVRLEDAYRDLDGELRLSRAAATRK